jgi:hypothetical protein
LNTDLVVLKYEFVSCPPNSPTHKDDGDHEELAVHLTFDG